MKTCVECGCTDERACRGGCSWFDDEQSICSACVLPFLQATSQQAFFALLRKTRSARLLEVIAHEMRGRIVVQEHLLMNVKVRLAGMQVMEGER